MNVAIVGASDSVDKIFNILSTKYTDIKFILKKEDKIEKILAVVKDIEEEIEGIFLTGIGVYDFLMNNENIDIKVPVTYTKRGNIGLIKNFWELKKRNFSTKNLKLGIDVIDMKIIIDTVKEFDIDINNLFYQKYESEKSELQYLREYLDKYKNQEIEYIFTAFGYIYNALKEKNIPVFRLQATNIEIENEFLNLLNRIEIIKNTRGKIGIEIIRVDLKEEDSNENILKNKVKLEKQMLDYTREIEGRLQEYGQKEYMIISNIDILKTNESLNKIMKIKKNFEEVAKISVGIGEGSTILKAEKNSRLALKLSLNNGGRMFYSNGEKIKGPLLNVRELEYKKVSDERIESRAKEIGISPIYLEKIIGMIKKQKKNKFTSVEIAEILNITPRSANRIIKKIIEKNFAESIQVENSVTAGRPRRIINFLFK